MAAGGWRPAVITDVHGGAFEVRYVDEGGESRIGIRASHMREVRPLGPGLESDSRSQGPPALTLTPERNRKKHGNHSGKSKYPSSSPPSSPSRGHGHRNSPSSKNNMNNELPLSALTGAAPRHVTFPEIEVKFMDPLSALSRELRESPASSPQPQELSPLSDKGAAAAPTSQTAPTADKQSPMSPQPFTRTRAELDRAMHDKMQSLGEGGRDRGT
tara:strand:+ start:153 stop:797 length:645 start_codon:yes stop_codon:yes gene_type:complete